MARLPAAYQPQEELDRRQQAGTGLPGMPIETGPGAGRIAGSMAVDVLGGGVSAAAGYALAPATFGLSIPVLAIGGGMASSYAAQKIEGDGFSVGRMIASGLLNLIPGAGKLAATTTGKIAGRELGRFARKEAIRGGGIAMGEKAVQTAIDEQRFPTFEEFAASGAMGTVFGGAVGTGIGVAAQKGLFNKIGGLTPNQLNAKLQNPKDAEDIKDGIMELGQPDKTDVFKETIGTRRQFFTDGLAERINTTKLPISNQVYGAIAQDLTNAMDSKDASLKLDRFINAASTKRNENVDKRIRKGIDKGIKYGDVQSINRLKGTLFDDAMGSDAMAFKKRLMDDYNELDSQWKQKNEAEIDSLVARTIETDDANDLARVAVNIDKVNVEPTPLAKAGSKVARFLIPSKKLQDTLIRLGTKFKQGVLPSRNIGRGLADVLSEIKLLTRSSDKIALTAESAVNRAIKKATLTPTQRMEYANNIDRFLSGKASLDVLPPKIREEVGEELQMYRAELERLQYKLISYLGGDIGDGLDKDLRNQVITVIKKSIDDKNFVTRSFRFYADKRYSPGEGLEEKAVAGEARRIAKQIAKRENLDANDSAVLVRAREQAEQEMAQRNKYSAKAMQDDPSLAQKRAADKQEIKFQAQGILEGRGNISDELSEYLGEITDPGEKIFQTINKTSRLVNALKTDDALNKLFKTNEVKMALRLDASDATEDILTQTAYGAEVMQDIKVPKEVNDALRDIFYSDTGYLMNNAVGRFTLDLLKNLNALSKISKTIFNPASYAPNFIGNFSSVAASGINPLLGIGKGIRFGLSEFDGIRKAVLGKGEKGKANLKRLIRFQELGGGSANVMTSEIRKAGQRGLLGDAVQTIADPFSKVYNIGDTTMRYVAWEGTQRQLKKAIPELANEKNRDKLEVAAMRMVRNTFQDYDKVPEVLKKLSQIGITSPFINFTAELMRNTYNQGRYAVMMMKKPKKLLAELGLDGVKIDDKSVSRLRKLGMKRAGIFTGVMAGAGTAVEMIGSKAKDLFGDNYKNLSDEEKLALNETVAKSWHRGKRLIYIPNADGKTGKYMDTEYLIPQTLMTSAFVSGFKDDPLEVLPKLLKENFLGEGTFLLQAASNLYGKDANGRDISVDPGMVNRYMDNIGAFIKAAFEPGAVRELEKWNKTIRGSENALGTMAMMSRLMGVRWEEYDIERDAARRLAPDATAINNAKGLLGTSRKYDIKEQYDQNYVKLNQNREGILKKITGHYNNLKVLGLDAEQALNVLDKTALSTNDKFESITGYYSPMPYEEPVTKTEVYESLGDTPEQRLRAIQAMRGQVDPREVKNLLSMHKRMVRKSRRGEPTMPASLMLLRKMDKEDRLRRLTDPDGPYRLKRSNTPLIRELQRLGILERDMIPYLPAGQ